LQKFIFQFFQKKFVFVIIMALFSTRIDTQEIKLIYFVVRLPGLEMKSRYGLKKEN